MRAAVKPRKSQPESGHLWTMSVELRSLAYLIGMQRFDEIPPLDIEEIHWGVGRMLEKLSKRLRRFANELEMQERNKTLK